MFSAIRKIVLVSVALLLASAAFVEAGDVQEPTGPAKKQSVISRPCVEPMKNPGGDAQFPKFPPASVKIDPKQKDLFVPIKREEVRVLAESLKYTALKDQRGFRLSAKDGIKFSIERMGVLMQDITALLAKIHLEETLAALKKMPNPDKNAIAWGTQVAKAIDICGRQRYEGFGGDPAFQESLDIVQDNREILEKLILESKLPFPGAGAPGGGGPVDIR